MGEKGSKGDEVRNSFYRILRFKSSFQTCLFAHSVSPLWPIRFPSPYFCLSVSSFLPPFLFIFSSINALLLSYDGLWEPVYQSLFFFIAALLSCHIVFVWETNSAAHLRIIPLSLSPDGNGVFGRCSDAVISNWGFSFALFFLSSQGLVGPKGDPGRSGPPGPPVSPSYISSLQRFHNYEPAQTFKSKPIIRFQLLIPEFHGTFSDLVFGFIL